MPILLSNEIIAEKNKLNSNNPFLILLEIIVPGLEAPLRVVMNTEDITWRGYNWQAIQFELDEIGQGAGEVPQVNLRIANPERVIDPYLDMYDAYQKAHGFSPVRVLIYVVNTVDLKSGNPVVDYEYELKAPRADTEWVTFTLGASNPFDQRFPRDRMLKRHCRFRFRDARCGYSGTVASCPHTLEGCRALKNSKRFGGFPGIGKAGIYIGEATL